MEKKLFFFDIDGTLTDRRTGQVVPSAQRTLELLEGNGHFVSIATGRAHYKCRGLLEELGLENMVCSGGMGVVIKNKLVKNTPLDKEEALAVIHDAEEKGIGVLIAMDDSEKVYAQNDLFREQVGPRQEPTEYFIDSAFNVDEVEEIFKFYLALPKEQDQLIPEPKNFAKLRFVPEYTMCQHDNKKQGILDVLDYFGRPAKDVVVFGDDVNDLVMFDKNWTSIAMGNAVPELKAQADYVTDRNVDDGIYKACRKFGWI
ncbi:HAD family hydrolase [Enterococcus avium]|uniref:HAD family hydrolase n=1 Tax=Enterococcus avium TaxID=33945 RepID=A0ABD5F806_ENTAV|nr:HAD family hydrolase [Enterococcus avium]MDT2397800.1 HAD family hydrolase [Enterococcus avium]MDT2435729.1 HAD family hydrolase [Enterococcus avium]MDT2448645.1 HAD family hydrolase [Enterococcus avium]MDT2466170.1 HAD family hydrolase [Enterococcus avium]MDT2469858.1 HAD family hydrolase [Enterococcus avium]